MINDPTPREDVKLPPPVGYIRREDAEAAQAMVVERVAEIALEFEQCAAPDAIRALADTDGLALVQALRAERRMIVSHATMGGTDGEGLSVNEISVRITALRNSLYQEAQADRDRLAAANAALEAQVARLVGALEPFRLMSGELFARNWNASDVVIALDNPDDPPRLTFCDFLELHAALAEVQADARREGGE